MPRSPLALAALSTLAVPGLDVHHVQSVVAPDGFDAAVAIDGEKRRWVVRAPATAAAGAALEAEVAFLTGLEGYVDDGRLPFEVPRPAGFAPLPEGGRALVFSELPGHPLRVERVQPGPGLAASLGRSVAALHELPVALVEGAGLPVYGAEEYRRRRLAEVDEAAATGRVPSTLLRRWEKALEDVSVWRFRPTVTHSALSAETLLVRSGQLSAMTDFFEVQVADPADDLAWLLVSAPPESVDSILEAYRQRRHEMSDPHLLDRALLASELALARWLLHGVRGGMDDVVDDAVEMLTDLDRAATEVGAFAAATEDGPAAVQRSEAVTGVAVAASQVRKVGAVRREAAASDAAPAAGRADEATGVAASPADVTSSAATPTASSQRAQQAAAQSEALSRVLTPPLPPPPSTQEIETLRQEGFDVPDYDKTRPRPFEDVATTAFTAAVVEDEEDTEEAADLAGPAEDPGSQTGAASGSKD